MARQPSMLQSECEKQLGPRGQLKVTTSPDQGNRPIVRKWLVAQGMHSGVSYLFSVEALEEAYNDATDATLVRYWKHYQAKHEGRLELTKTEPEAKEEAKPEPRKEPKRDLDDGQLILDIIQRRGGGSVNEEQVKSLIDKALNEALKDREVKHKVEISNNGNITELEETVHPSFPKLLKICTIRQPDGLLPQVFLSGEAGSGKTTAGKLVAKALGKDCRIQGAIAQAFEILGYKDANGHYHRTAFRHVYEHGGVIIWDEVDGCDPMALLTVNAAIGNGTGEFPDGPVKRHPDCLMIATANTWGLGANADYCGRTKLDGAFLDRFAYRLPWNVDEVFEREISGNANWTRRVQRARAKAKAASLKVLITPRASIAGAALIANGFSEQRAAELTYLANLNDAQRKQIEGE